MKKTLLIFACIFPLILSSCKSNGVRSFYCLSEDKCVTVWKKANGEVYIIPDKYEDNNEPTISHIKTNNKQFLTLYFSEELPQEIVVRDEGNLEGNQKGYTIENRVKGEWKFSQYSDNYKADLYKSDARKFKDVKSGTDYLTISLQENYATDKTGKKLE